MQKYDFEVAIINNKPVSPDRNINPSPIRGRLLSEGGFYKQWFTDVWLLLEGGFYLKKNGEL